MTPACRKRASTTGSDSARAPVWDVAAREPARERPALTAMIGFLRATRRAMREKRTGLPKLSRYSRITSVRGSSLQYWIRSLPETSALLPTETNVEIPRFSFEA